MAYEILSNAALRTLFDARFPDRSLADCARLLQISHQRLRNYFRQKTIDPRDALQIAAHTGVPMDFLFGVRPVLPGIGAVPDGGERKAHLHAIRQRDACQTLANSIFEIGEIPTAELFNDLGLRFSKVNLADKKQMHIVQISFVCLAAGRRQVLLIRRMKHVYTKGFSVLQSTSELPPRSLADAEQVFRSEIEVAVPFTLRPLGFAANTLNVDQRYYFYVYEALFDQVPTGLRLTTDQQDECAFVPIDAWSQRVIEDSENRVDRMAWNAIAPRSRQLPPLADPARPSIWLPARGADFFGDA